jgi:elongator complex protein 1
LANEAKGEHKLILLTSSFDVLSEKPLHIEDFGEGKLPHFLQVFPRTELLFISPDAPINVGWGSKETQFHGSLGKTAAQAPSTSKIGISPDDDNLPRISWRGDSALFVVSSLSPTSNGRSRRTLRVYDRQGPLQTTSEEVAGLEHPLVWRPSGNLIVGTQRFGFEGGGAGSEGRHDVIFFERNGLRHGEFTLRVDQIGVKDKGVEHERRWGYKVRELAWNSDSNVLAIWIESDVGDIGKIFLFKIHTRTWQ